MENVFLFLNKALTAYAIFVKKMRKDYLDLIKKGALDKEKMADLMKQMGKKWGEIDEKVKEMFNMAALRDKERFDREMQESEIQGEQNQNIQDYDAKRPKKCLSSYMIFVRETRPIVSKELKTQGQKESKYFKLQYLDGALHVMKEVGKRWKSLTPDKKKIFAEKAKEDKKRYNIQMEEFQKEISKINVTSHDNKNSRMGGKSSNSGLLIVEFEQYYY